MRKIPATSILALATAFTVVRDYDERLVGRAGHSGGNGGVPQHDSELMTRSFAETSQRALVSSIEEASNVTIRQEVQFKAHKDAGDGTLPDEPPRLEIVVGAVDSELERINSLKEPYDFCQAVLAIFHIRNPREASYAFQIYNTKATPSMQNTFLFDYKQPTRVMRGRLHKTPPRNKGLRLGVLLAHGRQDRLRSFAGKTQQWVQLEMGRILLLGSVDLGDQGQEVKVEALLVDSQENVTLQEAKHNLDLAKREKRYRDAKHAASLILDAVQSSVALKSITVSFNPLVEPSFDSLSRGLNLGDVRRQFDKILSAASAETVLEAVGDSLQESCPPSARFVTYSSWVASSTLKLPYRKVGCMLSLQNAEQCPTLRGSPLYLTWELASGEVKMALHGSPKDESKVSICQDSKDKVLRFEGTGCTSWTVKVNAAGKLEAESGSIGAFQAKLPEACAKMKMQDLARLRVDVLHALRVERLKNVVDSSYFVCDEIKTPPIRIALKGRTLYQQYYGDGFEFEAKSPTRDHYLGFFANPPAADQDVITAKEIASRLTERAKAVGQSKASVDKKCSSVRDYASFKIGYENLLTVMDAIAKKHFSSTWEKIIETCVLFDVVVDKSTRCNLV
jgi:hypothetical protein